MQAYQCTVCGYLYDEESAERSPENHIIPFEELDPDWLCPTCGCALALFQPTESDRTPDESQDDRFV